MILTELTYVALLPLAVAAVAALAMRTFRLSAHVTWPICVALAYIAGQTGLASRAGNALSALIHPREAADWLPHAVLFALAVTLLATLAPRPWNRIAVALALVLTIGLPLRLLAGSAYDLQWTPLEKFAHITLLSATLAATWLILSLANAADHPLLRPLLLIVVACSAAVVVSLSGVFMYGELCGVVAAALTGTLLASHTPHVAAAAGVITISLGSLILLSCFYAELSPSNAALLFLALVFAAGPMELSRLGSAPGEPPQPATEVTARPLKRALKTTLRVALTMLPLAIALARTIAATQTSVPANPYWQ